MSERSTSFRLAITLVYDRLMQTIASQTQPCDADMDQLEQITTRVQAQAIAGDLDDADARLAVGITHNLAVYAKAHISWEERSRKELAEFTSDLVDLLGQSLASAYVR